MHTLHPLAVIGIVGSMHVQCSACKHELYLCANRITNGSLEPNMHSFRISGYLEGIPVARCSKKAGIDDAMRSHLPPLLPRIKGSIPHVNQSASTSQQKDRALWQPRWDRPLVLSGSPANTCTSLHRTATRDPSWRSLQDGRIGNVHARSIGS